MPSSGYRSTFLRYSHAVYDAAKSRRCQRSSALARAAVVMQSLSRAARPPDVPADGAPAEPLLPTLYLLNAALWAMMVRRRRRTLCWRMGRASEPLRWA